MQFMGMAAAEIESKVKAALPDAQIELVDLAGDNDHWQITVTSAQFAGKSRVEQHRMVTGALGASMGTTLHALAVKTKIP
jgi:stress-induced morphogen